MSDLQTDEKMNRFMMEFHRTIQHMVSPTIPDTTPNSMVSLLFPGQSINEKDFYCIPAHEEESSQSPEKEANKGSMSRLVDCAFIPGPTCNPTATRISTIYAETILGAALPPEEIPILTVEQAAILKSVEDYVSVNTNAYNTFADDYAMACIDYWEEKNKNPNSAAAKKLKIQVGSKMRLWQASGKQKFEEKEAIKRQLMSSCPGGYFAAVKAKLLSYGTQEYPCEFMPSNWASEEDSLPWNKFEFDSHKKKQNVTISQTEMTILKEEIYRADGFFEKIARWFRPSPITGTETTEEKQFFENINKTTDLEDLKISCELARVGVYRDWFDLGVLAYKKARCVGIEIGGISTGELSDKNRGALASYTTGLILAQNIKAEMTVNEETANSVKNLLDENGKPKKVFACGNFECNETTNVRVDTKKTETGENCCVITIESPKKQIIGFVNTVVPRFPLVEG